MKVIWIIIIIVFSYSPKSFSQDFDTLYHYIKEFGGYGPMIFVLDSGKTFKYTRTWHVASEFGTGVYSKKFGRIKFVFDSLKCPVIQKLSILNGASVVHIAVNDIFDSYPLPFIRVIYDSNELSTDWEGNISIEYTGGEIEIQLTCGTAIINPALDDCSEYGIKSTHFGCSNVPLGETMILRKRFKKYMLRETKFRYSEYRDKYHFWGFRKYYFTKS
ncbi:MAG: hypothetical protein IIA45_10465 [Bacteroidetes bacterium]|nr:hypothetical protein [Bacteroidota bacterium]